MGMFLLLTPGWFCLFVFLFWLMWCLFSFWSYYFGGRVHVINDTMPSEEGNCHNRSTYRVFWKEMWSFQPPENHILPWYAYLGTSTGISVVDLESTTFSSVVVAKGLFRNSFHSTDGWLKHKSYKKKRKAPQSQFLKPHVAKFQMMADIKEVWLVCVHSRSRSML